MGMTTSCCAAKKWMMKRNGAACNGFDRVSSSSAAVKELENVI